MSAEKTAWKLYGTRQTGISSIQPQSVIGLQFLSYLTITTLIIMDTSGQKLSTSRELYSTEYQIESKRIKGKRENYSAVFLFFFSRLRPTPEVSMVIGEQVHYATLYNLELDPRWPLLPALALRVGGCGCLRAAGSRTSTSEDLGFL